jgi:NADPH-dependent glutamate synthase beta subunit-like oxidoreductase
VQVPGEGYHRDLIACQRACPVNTDARGYVRAIAEGRFEEAYLIARGPNPFASICGRICGAPCEAACRRGRIPRVDADGGYIGDDRPISIRALKRFVCSLAGPDTRDAGDVLENVRDYVPRVAAGAEEMAAMLRSCISGRFVPARGEPIAIIGAGPAGLSAAHDLALMGFRPTVFEAEPVAAGMLALGVPEYRLPRELIRREIAMIEALGVTIRCGVRVGSAAAIPARAGNDAGTVSFADLRRDFAAVIIAVGAKRSRTLSLPGEAGPHVYGGVDLLRAVSLDEPIAVGSNVVVIGGGNVAYDVARTIVRQISFDAARAAARLPGTRAVHLISLETLEEMPADTVEIVEGDEEGIQRMNGWGPIEIQRDDAGRVTGVLLRRCLRVYDEARRFAPLFDENDRRVIPCDTVLLAAGQTPDLAFLKEGGEDLAEARPGWLKVDAATLATSAPDVFVAGDLAHGTRLLIDAVASGKRAARSVYRHVTGREIQAELLEAHIPLERYRREPGYETLPRAEIPTLPPAERLAHPSSCVEVGFDRTHAMREASRCLDCGVTPVFDGSRCVLCGGCVDVCPTSCLKIVSLSQLEPQPDLVSAIEAALGAPDLDENSAILKDEDRCIRCALCEMRCPVGAITMERVTFGTIWRAAS